MQSLFFLENSNDFSQKIKNLYQAQKLRKCIIYTLNEKESRIFWDILSQSKENLSVKLNKNVTGISKILLCYYILNKIDKDLIDYLDLISLDDILYIINILEEYDILYEFIFPKVFNIKYFLDKISNFRKELKNNLILKYGDYLLQTSKLDLFFELQGEVDQKMKYKLYEISFNYRYKEPIRRYLFDTNFNTKNIFSNEAIKQDKNQLDYVLNVIEEYSNVNKNDIFALVFNNVNYIM